MWSNIYPRLYELSELARNEGKSIHSRDNYFYMYEEEIKHPLSKEKICLLENDLSRLDVEAWNQLKEKFRKQSSIVLKVDEGRCWQQLSNFLNEVKGYIYLQNANYSKVQFIEDGKKRTLDFYATGNKGTAILEVKTINISDDEVDFRSPNTPIRCKDIELGLSEELRLKILADIDKAENQLQSYCKSYCSSEFPKVLIVLCINFDSGSKGLKQNLKEFKEFAQESKPQSINEILVEQGYQL